MRSRDRQPRVRAPQGELLLSMLCFVGCLDTGWDLDPSSSNSVVDAARPTGSPPRACHQRHLQPQWWTLSDPPTVPPKRLVIDVIFKLGGG
jgi:hypothetical protein